MRAFTFLAIPVVAAGLALGALVCLVRFDPAPPVSNQQLSELVDCGRGEAYERIMIKHGIACELAQGKLTVIGAAAKVKAMDLPAFFWKLLPIVDRGDSTDERLCWHILEWTVGTCWEDSDSTPAASLRQRLESELKDYLDYHGAITLPRPCMSFIETRQDSFD